MMDSSKQAGQELVNPMCGADAAHQSISVTKGLVGWME
jgi:hypothetical protein